MRHFVRLFASIFAAAPALAQSGVAVPLGQNLRDRPDQPGDVVLEINAAGSYTLNGRPVAAAQLTGQLGALIARTRDRVVYVRADARLSASAIDSANAIAARSAACVVSFVGTQPRGMMSFVSGDAGPEAGNVRRAIDVQLPLPQASRNAIARQQAEAVVLEVLPGPAYRINTQPVAADNLQRRLLEIFNARPLKVLYLRGDPAVTYQDVFRAMDAARYAGVIDIVAPPPGFTIRSRLPDIDLSMRVTDRNDSTAARLEGNVGRCRRGDVYFGQLASTPGNAPNAEPVYFEFQVETRVRRLADSVALHYPDMLRVAKVNGEVLVQFVVDANGRALPETFKVLRSTHDLFTQSVKDALPAMRFAPATIGGKPVRQLVQMPFQFNITP